jgi:hypothetical protein
MVAVGAAPQGAGSTAAEKEGVAPPSLATLVATLAAAKTAAFIAVHPLSSGPTVGPNTGPSFCRRAGPVTRLLGAIRTG